MSDPREFEQLAEAAADRAGIRIRLSESLADVVAVSEILASIWATPPDRSPGEVSTLVALRHAGGYVAGAWRGSEILGASFGFVSLRAGRLGLHSHVTGAVEASRGVGTALKFHQRAWAAAKDLDEITWTFDPLIRRNAHFNLNVLNARIVSYHENLYGALEDGFNGRDETDRCTVVWDLRSSSGMRAVRSGWGFPDDSILVGHDRAVRDDAGRNGSPGRLVALPDDIVRIRTEAPSEATAWRSVYRRVLGPMLAAGDGIGELTSDGFYVVDRAR